MKRLFFVTVCLVWISGCAATHMVKPEQPPQITANPDSALLVLVRDTYFGGAIVFWNYLDGKLIGETQGGTYIVAEVPPGKHYLVAATENTAVAEMDIKAGRIYYLRQGITIGVWRARTTGFSPMTPEDAAEAIKGCTYMELDPSAGGEDMAPELYQQAIDEYHQELKENPEGFKEMLEYQGHVPE